MSIKLSHSAVNKYQLCGHSYKLHYLDKIRPKYTTGALLFGDALDQALNAMLTGEAEYESLFTKAFTNSRINDSYEYLPTSTNIVYATSDLDIDLLDEAAHKAIAGRIKIEFPDRPSGVLETISAIKTKRTAVGFEFLTKQEKIIYNLACWYCLEFKGKLMLNAYLNKVYPKIKKVHTIQKRIDLNNNTGDSIMGFVDAVMDIEGHGTVIVDHKTSSMDYEEDSVLTSAQLALYVHALSDEYKTRKAGYIVLKKQVAKNKGKICKSCGHDGSNSRHATCNNTIEGKRCNGEWDITIKPDIDIQVIIDEIPELTEQIVIENYDIINNSIKSGLFPKNFSSCNNFFGGKCPYINYCFKNKMQGLIKK